MPSVKSSKLHVAATVLHPRCDRVAPALQPCYARVATGHAVLRDSPACGSTDTRPQQNHTNRMVPTSTPGCNGVPHNTPNGLEEHTPLRHVATRRNASQQRYDTLQHGAAQCNAVTVPPILGEVDEVAALLHALQPASGPLNATAHRNVAPRVATEQHALQRNSTRCNAAACAAPSCAPPAQRRATQPLHAQVPHAPEGGCTRSPHAAPTRGQSVRLTRSPIRAASPRHTRTSAAAAADRRAGSGTTSSCPACARCNVRAVWQHA
jgi:hypothetical protein